MSPTVNVLISCNKCGTISSNEERNKFFLLNCFHVLCIQCIKDGFKTSKTTSRKTITCDSCDKTVSFWTIGKDMDIDKKMMFLDPMTVIRSTTARLIAVFSFQDRQHEFLKRHAAKKTRLNIGILKNLHANSVISQTCSNVVEDDKKKIRGRILEKREVYEILKERHKKPYPVHVSLGANTNTQKLLSMGECKGKLNQQKELSFRMEIMGLMTK
uniref:RING-type domain-containing protein n=1 Tax=Strongyloides venezuelensis TaxID=75913 RepID=A0A0K0EYK7_STRVS